jgi:glucokinase
MAARHGIAKRVLAGDIGGTKINLGIFRGGKGRPKPEAIETYRSGEAPGLEDVIASFTLKHPAPVSGVCLGVPGPVRDGICKTTNLPWIVSEPALALRFGWKHVRLLNDLAAACYAVPSLTAEELFPLSRAKIRKGETAALIAPGTGLGMGLLVFTGAGMIPIPSEGGHASFSPGEEKELDLWRHLSARFGHVSVERLLSGPGILNIYTWLKDSGRFQEPAGMREMIEQGDPARVITETALSMEAPLCDATLDMFVTLLGRTAGNLALTALATGGVYLGGGIPPKILPRLRSDRFLEAFTAKGRLRRFLEDVPVQVILNEEAALLGAAVCALNPPVVR